MQTSEDASLQAGTSDVPDKLAKLAEKKFRDFSKGRFAEEREWYELALFYQRRQWLTWDATKRRWNLVKRDERRPKPMPVTNYFRKFVNQVANQLGAKAPQMMALPHDDSEEMRRASDAAEKAVPAIDKESGFPLLVPQLAKHVSLWGIDVTKDFVDNSRTAGSVAVPVMQLAAETQLQCLTCGTVLPVSLVDDGQPVANGRPCPACGSTQTQTGQKLTPQVSSVEDVPRSRIVTEVRPIFEIYLPRDCQNPNLAASVVHRYRKTLGEARRLWGSEAEELAADDKSSASDVYLDALRSLINYNAMQEQQGEQVSITEWWFDWDELDEDFQNEIEAEEPDAAQKMKGSGGYVIAGSGRALDWGANTLGKNRKPFTFYQFELDPANPYNQGAGADLVPLQKRLNRLDSLIELAIQTNAAGKWLWPKTQSGNKPSGSPVEVVEYDPIGPDKAKPEWMNLQPLSPQAYQLRAQIIADMREIAYTSAVAEGQSPGGGNMPFRGMAYLGAKASEMLNTPRALWENAHQLRYEKCMVLAQQVWDEPRRVAVGGANGRLGMSMLMGRDLKGGYELDFVPDSSRPVTLSEKIEIFGMLLQGALVNPQDASTRDYVMDMVNMDGLNLADHNEYLKAFRDIERLKMGQPPQPNPFMKYGIHLGLVTTYIQTEEYEALPPPVQQGFVMYASWLEQQMAPPPMLPGMPPPPAGPPGAPPAQALGAAMQHGAAALHHGSGPVHSPLEGIPGGTVQPASAEAAAAKQGTALAGALP